MGASEDLGKTSVGMDANIAGLLAYVLGLITGIVFLVIEKENKFVRFHAMQSLALSVACFIASIVLAMIPIIGWLALPVLQLGALVLWIICMIKAYQKEWFKIPFIGDIAAKQVGV